MFWSFHVHNFLQQKSSSPSIQPLLMIHACITELSDTHINEKTGFGQPEIKCKLRQDLDTWIVTPQRSSLITAYVCCLPCLPMVPAAVLPVSAGLPWTRSRFIRAHRGEAINSDSDFKISGTDCFGQGKVYSRKKMAMTMIYDQTITDLFMIQAVCGSFDHALLPTMIVYVFLKQVSMSSLGRRYH